MNDEAQAQAQATEEVAPPALFDHCCRVYAAMLAEAHAVDSEGQKMVVYEGFLTTLITGKLNLSVPYYSSVRRALKRMGCIRQLRRGGGSSQSQWELITDPTFELFQSQAEVKSRTPTKTEALDYQITVLISRIAELEEWQSSINDFLAEKYGTEEAS